MTAASYVLDPNGLKIKLIFKPFSKIFMKQKLDHLFFFQRTFRDYTDFRGFEYFLNDFKNQMEFSRFPRFYEI